MITWNAIKRYAHLPEYMQRFVQVSRLLDDVSGEADRIRREPVDQGNNAYEIRSVALVVDIADMHDPKGRALAQGKSGDLDPVGFNEDGDHNAVSKTTADEEAEPLLSDEHLHLYFFVEQ